MHVNSRQNSISEISVVMADTRLTARFQTIRVQGLNLMPEPPLLFAGAFGGPCIIAALTPLRNACTLAAQDKTSTARQIYQKVFTRGVRSGWVGATTPAAAAAVQFTTLGPGYYVYLNLLGSSAAAVAAGAVTETLITYGPSTRNAQLMNNAVANPADKVPIRPLRPVGPGFTALVLRNSCANAGIRVLSEPLGGALSGLSGASPEDPMCRFGGDFLASVFCGGLSMPFNQLFNFQVTSAASLKASPEQRVALGLNFLRDQYFVPSGTRSWQWQLSRMVWRDGVLRSLYIGCMFSSYAAVERMTLSLARGA